MSAMSELDARIREAIAANEPVTITLRYSDADALATLLCRIENIPERFVMNEDDVEEVADLGDLATRLFETVCKATNDALESVR